MTRGGVLFPDVGLFDLDPLSRSLSAKAPPYGISWGVGVVEILRAFPGITVQGEESVAKTPHGKIEAILRIIREEYRQFLLNFSVKYAIILLL